MAVIVCRSLVARVRLHASKWQVPTACIMLRRHLAASEGCYKVTEWLIAEGSDVNALDRFKRTPLEVHTS